MFDKTLFDKTLFDRIHISDGITINMFGDGYIDEYPFEFLTSPVDVNGLSISGEGTFILFPVMQQNVYPESIDNDGYLELIPILRLEMDIDLYGDGELDLFRIGNYYLKRLDIREVSLNPGETIIVDTDLMTVLINSEYNVSGLTNLSEFFQLKNGLNQISFNAVFDSPPHPRGDEELDVYVIFSDRWL